MASYSSLESIEKYNNQQNLADYVMIFLHGLGSDYNDFLPFMNELKLTKNVKFIFPNAPIRPITINNGYSSRAWYDIITLDNNQNLVDHIGIATSVKQIDQIIREQINLGFVNKIVLGGFSQGGVISLTTLLTSSHKLAGIVSLSSYLPNCKTLLNINNTINKTTPVFIAHGLSDTMVPNKAGLYAFNELKDNAYNVSWYEYDMAHNVCSAEIIDLTNWLNNIPF